MHNTYYLLGLPHQMMMPGMRPVLPAGFRPRAQVVAPQQIDAGLLSAQKRPSGSFSGEHLDGQLRKDQNGPNLNFQEETDPNEKVLPCSFMHLSFCSVVMDFLFYAYKTGGFCVIYIVELLGLH